MLEEIARSRDAKLRTGKAEVTEDTPGRILSVSPNRRSPGTPNMEDAMIALSAPSPSPILPDAPQPEHPRQPQPAHVPDPEERDSAQPPPAAMEAAAEAIAAARATTSSVSSTSASLARMRKILN